MKWAALNSIRWRMQAWHGLLLLVVIIAFGVTGWYLARENRLKQEDDALVRHTNTFLFSGAFRGPPRRGRPGEPWRGPGPDEEPPRDRRDPRPPTWTGELSNHADEIVKQGYYFAIWDMLDNTLWRASANAPADLPRPEASVVGEIRSRPPFREHYQSPARRPLVLVGRDVSAVERELRRLAWLLSAAGASVWLLSLLGGWWVARHSLRPIAAISASARRIAAGDLAERISVKESESELGQLSQVLNETFDKLQQAFARQAQFTADAAHELRTPVTILRAQTESILAKPRAPEEYREALESCQRAANRMSQLTESLLALSRWDAADQPLAKETCDLLRLARETVELAEPLAEAHQVRLLLEGEKTACHCDPRAISQVAMNLVSNAIHYNRAGGEVRVKVHSADGQSVLTVEDTGPGIAEEDLPHVFDRFYRADKSRTSTRGGVGLGLAICKAIAEAHDGKLEATSEVGVGSSFTLSLPCQTS